MNDFTLTDQEQWANSMLGCSLPEPMMRISESCAEKGNFGIDL